MGAYSASATTESRTWRAGAQAAERRLLQVTSTATRRRTWHVPVCVAGGQSPRHSATGDFDGDGKDDIALDGPRGWATTPIAYSKGNGSYKVSNNRITHFASWASTPGAKLLAGKFNKDKKVDIALAGGRGWRTLPTAITK